MLEKIPLVGPTLSAGADIASAVGGNPAGLTGKMATAGKIIKGVEGFQQGGVGGALSAAGGALGGAAGKALQGVGSAVQGDPLGVAGAFMNSPNVPKKDMKSLLSENLSIPAKQPWHFDNTEKYFNGGGMF